MFFYVCEEINAIHLNDCSKICNLKASNYITPSCSRISSSSLTKVTLTVRSITHVVNSTISMNFLIHFVTCSQLVETVNTVTMTKDENCMQTLKFKITS